MIIKPALATSFVVVVVVFSFKVYYFPILLVRSLFISFLSTGIMKNKRSLFFLSTSRNSREFVLDSPLATRWFLSAFVLFCFVSRLVGCFFFGLLLEAIEVRTLNSIKGSTYTGEFHSKYLMNGWCCKYLVSAKEQEYRNLNILYNINAYLPADWAFNPTIIWTEIQHKYSKVVLVLWHMKKN